MTVTGDGGQRDRAAATKSGSPAFRVAPLVFTAAFLLVIAGIAYRLMFPPPKTAESNILAAKFPEPSGIVFHPSRKTLFVASDEGYLGELTTDGRILQIVSVAGANFEGITVDRATGYLYALIERENRILEIVPERLTVRRRFDIAGNIGAEILLPLGSEGLEGITFIADKDSPEGGRFFVLNRGPVAKGRRDPRGCSFLAEISVPLKSSSAKEAAATIVGFALCEEGDLSDLTWDAGSRHFIAISDRENCCVEMDKEGRVLRRSPLAGKTQEGIAFDDVGYMYVAQDSGGILKLPARRDRARRLLP